MTEKPSMTFEILERSITGWQAKTFPDAHPRSIAAHLLSECVELARSVGMSEDAIASEVGRSLTKPIKDKPEKELGDVVHLVIGMAKALGSDVVGVTLPVYQSNRGRAWGAADPVTGVVEHVEDDEETTPLRCIDGGGTGVTGQGVMLATVASAVHVALGLDPWPSTLIPPEAGFFSFGYSGAMIEMKCAQDSVAVGVMRRREDGSRETLAVFIVHGANPLTTSEMRAALRVETWRIDPPMPEPAPLQEET